MDEKDKYCCTDHIDMAFDDFLIETETFPLLETIVHGKCSYCDAAAKYVLKKIQN